MESKLKELRTQLGISSTSLSHLMGVNQSSVLRYEQSELAGAISLSSLRKYAAALGYILEYRFVKEKQNTITSQEDNKYKTNKEKFFDLGRRESELSNFMKSSEIETIISLDPVSKLKRAYELSCFVRKLKSA